MIMNRFREGIVVPSPIMPNTARHSGDVSADCRSTHLSRLPGKVLSILRYFFSSPRPHNIVGSDGVKMNETCQFGAMVMILTSRTSAMTLALKRQHVFHITHLPDRTYLFTKNIQNFGKMALYNR